MGNAESSSKQQQYSRRGRFTLSPEDGDDSSKQQQHGRRGRYTLSPEDGDDSAFLSHGRVNSSSNTHNTHTTASTNSQSVADQSISMMKTLVSGGAALCGSLGQVNDDDDDQPAEQGMFAKAEQFVNCNKSFAKSSPMEEEYDARARRHGGNFLGPEEDSDDETEGGKSNGRNRSHGQGNSIINESSGASSTVSRVFARASEIVSKPQGMDTDKLVEDGQGSEAEVGVGVNADRALRALKKFAMNAAPSGGGTPANRNGFGPVPPLGDAGRQQAGPHTITIGLSLSRKNSVVGHPDTVTRQTAFDFNDLQDRYYKYVSSTDPSGWLAGGGESSSGPMPDVTQSTHGGGDDDGPTAFVNNINCPVELRDDIPQKIAAPDTIHITILRIDCPSEKAVEQVIKSLANGEIIIPHMSVLPESLSATGDSPPDLAVRFRCERDDDRPSDEWPNWSLEFMHNQLYDYFEPLGARWESRPFEVVLARKVKWRTV